MFLLVVVYVAVVVVYVVVSFVFVLSLFLANETNWKR